MSSVAIIGAGITGLTAAFHLQRQGIQTTVYESSGRVGGVIRSVRQGDYLVECGPNTLLETSSKISQLVTDAGLTSRRREANPRASARYLVQNGRPVALPSSPLGFLKTKLFSGKAKLGLLREPFVPPRREQADESVADFMERRLGREFLERAVDPLVAGIYAGDARRLSVRHAFPKLAELESRYGSLIKGQIFGARARKNRDAIPRSRAAKFSFDEGLQVLPDTLRERLGEAVRLHATVTKLEQKAAGWSLEFTQNTRQSRAEHSVVIFAGTAHKLAELDIVSKAWIGLGELKEIRCPPVASVALGFRREDVAHSCEGFGLLVPAVEGLNILGTMFSSSLFPERAPKGHVLLTTFAGGERNPELAQLPAGKIIAAVVQDLRLLLGVTGKPVFEHCFVYPKAIPQYNVGYGRFLDLMVRAEKNGPGLFLAGHYRDGVALTDSILSGCRAAERASEYLGIPKRE